MWVLALAAVAWASSWEPGPVEVSADGRVVVTRHEGTGPDGRFTGAWVELYNPVTRERTSLRTAWPRSAGSAGGLADDRSVRVWRAVEPQLRLQRTSPGPRSPDGQTSVTLAPVPGAAQVDVVLERQGQVWTVARVEGGPAVSVHTSWLGDRIVVSRVEVLEVGPGYVHSVVDHVIQPLDQTVSVVLPAVGDPELVGVVRDALQRAGQGGWTLERGGGLAARTKVYVGVGQEAVGSAIAARLPGAVVEHHPRPGIRVVVGRDQVREVEPERPALELVGWVGDAPLVAMPRLGGTLWHLGDLTAWDGVDTARAAHVPRRASVESIWLDGRAMHGCEEQLLPDGEGVRVLFTRRSTLRRADPRFGVGVPTRFSDSQRQAGCRTGDGEVIVLNHGARQVTSTLVLSTYSGFMQSIGPSSHVYVRDDAHRAFAREVARRLGPGVTVEPLTWDGMNADVVIALDDVSGAED